MGGLARYADDELLLIRDFLRAGREFLAAHTERIKALPAVRLTRAQNATEPALGGEQAPRGSSRPPPRPKTARGPEQSRDYRAGRRTTRNSTGCQQAFAGIPHLIHRSVHSRARPSLRSSRPSPPGDGDDLGAREPAAIRRGSRASRRGVRGTEARAHIDKLSRKYTGRDYDGARIQSERVLLRIAPDFQHLREPPS